MKEKYKSILQTELNKLKKAFEKMGIHLESKIQKKIKCPNGLKTERMKKELIELRKK